MWRFGQGDRFNVSCVLVYNNIYSSWTSYEAVTEETYCDLMGRYAFETVVLDEFGKIIF